ncbi:RNA recognition motif-containing protein RRM [Dictyostelium discoideum AX4]|uniref:RNA recognition motif-containing protein RRM n=1 Tax=Dictyostelium discoideum TaxID=44689 RepID=Q54WE9_DICDI|nr:RNA recognition motif-containing protein RRM [Dictyostelium discoideum AX4]EAL67622.1 RNA recognition motif-containing protein RRM [Dictyostelium discoideum AX4]|eukprot:XP_641604.1 RNA recognition motif-containing protein RRM [Dictyostelium discoideum AX4]
MTNRIFVARIPWSICKIALKTHFSKFGPVSDGYVVLDRITKRSKGFGFVTFDNAESAQNAVNSVHEMDGRQLVVNLAFDKLKTN